MTPSETSGTHWRAGWRREWSATWAHKPRVISSPRPCSRQNRRTSGHSRRDSLEMAHDVGLRDEVRR